MRKGTLYFFKLGSGEPALYGRTLLRRSQELLLFLVIRRKICMLEQVLDYGLGAVLSLAGAGDSH